MLYSRVREDLGLAYTLGGTSVSGLDTGYFLIYVATTSKNTEIVKKIVEEEIVKFKREPLDHDILEDMKKDIIGSHRRLLQTNSMLGFTSCLQELYGLGFNYYEKFETQINNLKAEKLKQVANKYLDLSKSVVIITKSEFK